MMPSRSQTGQLFQGCRLTAVTEGNAGAVGAWDGGTHPFLLEGFLEART